MMRFVTLAACLAVLLNASGALAAANGPTAVYNEAVKVTGGKRQVQLPPFSNDDRVAFGLRKLPSAEGVGEQGRGTVANPVFMVESPSGLFECVLPVFHKKHCRPSTYGTAKLNRSWTVLRGNRWHNCSDPTKVVESTPPPPNQRAKERAATYQHVKADPAYECTAFDPREAWLSFPLVLPSAKEQ